ncbi:MAG TPA: B12-binding domain-containing radical SAM protein, partial [Proteobacteria bacterium]|nr:B12-binding domain-containing radical SAM protein [Pseudomonadota bacterium]
MMRIAAHFVADAPDIKGFPPLCFGYLYSYLRMYGPQVEMRMLHSADEIVRYRPDVVALSATTLNYTLARNLAHDLKRRLDVPIVIGGVHITVLPSSLYREFDIGIVGEGEQTFCELVDLFERKGAFHPDDIAGIDGLVFRADGRLVQTAPRSLIAPLDRIPHPDRRFVGQSGDEAYMFTSRGCPYRCSFCSSQVHWGKYRVFSPEYVVDEIEELHREFGVKKLHFFDDIFVADIDRLERIAGLIEERGLHGKMEFSCAIRANLADERLMKVLKRMGINRVTFGAESNSARILRYLKGRGITPQDNQRAVDMCHKFGIKISPSFIKGAPDETGDDLMETYKFLIRNIRDKKIDYFEFHKLTPFPGTKVWDEAKDMGLVSDDLDDWSRLRYPSEYFYMNRVMPKSVFYFFEDLNERVQKMLGLFGHRLIAVLDVIGLGEQVLECARALARSRFFEMLVAIDLERLRKPKEIEEELKGMGYAVMSPQELLDATSRFGESDIFCFIKPAEPFDIEAVKNLVWHHYATKADLTRFAPYKFFYPVSGFERELYVMGRRAFEQVAKRYIADIGAGRKLVPAERLVEEWGCVELY